LIRRSAIICILFAVSAVSGCDSGSAVLVSSNPVEYVGEYVLMPNDGTHVQFADVLILKKDYTAVGVRLSRETEQVLTSKTKWSLNHTNTENVNIGEFSYPIERTGSSIILSINDDEHLRYEKIR